LAIDVRKFSMFAFIEGFGKIYSCQNIAKKKFFSPNGQMCEV